MKVIAQSVFAPWLVWHESHSVALNVNKIYLCTYVRCQGFLTFYITAKCILNKLGQRYIIGDFIDLMKNNGRSYSCIKKNCSLKLKLFVISYAFLSDFAALLVTWAWLSI